MAAAKDIVHREAIELRVQKQTKPVFELEQAMATLPDDEKLDIDSMTQHFFGPGVYLRQFFLPAGCVVTGKVHKTEHLTIIASGVCAFAAGEDSEFMVAPFVFTNKVGDKRAVYAIEDTVIMTVHATEEQDVSKLEEELVTNDVQEITQLLLDRGDQ